MKPEDPISASGTSIVGSSRAIAEKRNEKQLKLTLEAGHPGSAVVLHCQGRMIFHREAQTLASIVTEVLPSARRMVVDLAGTDSFDSGALGELVLTHMWAEAAGYTLKFACPSKSVRSLFESTNLLSVFDVYASVPEAMMAMVQDDVRPT